jgi:glycerate kinase
VRTRWFADLIVAVDVQNPLLGTCGATRVYGPQKGLRAEDFAKAEKCLRALAKFCSSGLRPPPFNRGRSSPCAKATADRQSPATKPGAGAAGGLGFGLMAFVGAKAEPGFELFARFAKLEKLLRDADLVITGEGCIDESTFMGKGVGEIARRCRKGKIPCVAFAGKITARAAASHFFAEAHALMDATTVTQAKSNPAAWLEKLTERLANANVRHES